MSHFPQHIAIIPDGNRRWAKARGLPAGEGHRRGVKKFREIMDEAFLAGIPCMTFWAASEDNLIKRSRLEVRLLVTLLHNELTSEEFQGKLMKDKISIRFVGWWNEILHDAGLAKAIHAIESKTVRFFTQGGHGRRLTILLGYDGRHEMVEAIKELSRSKKEVSFDAVGDALWTGFLPPVDLVIRTGEEQVGWTHWSSGFMMWLTAQSQFYFTKTFWPDFSVKEFDQVLAEFAERERRLGK
jgi:undecaprenyl diphosphate synthase